MKGKIARVTLGLALAMSFMLPAAQMTFADHDRDFKEDCHRRIESDRARVDREAAKHGEHSRQVDRAVDKLQSDKQWCRDHKADYDHKFDIGIYVHR
jgi:hypothetical protein